MKRVTSVTSSTCEVAHRILPSAGRGLGVNAGAGFGRRDADVEDTQGLEEKGKRKAG